MEPLTDTLIERVDKLIESSKVPLEWGSPLLSVTPTSVAIRRFAAQVAALESAVREIALEVQNLSASPEPRRGRLAPAREQATTGRIVR